MQKAVIFYVFPGYYSEGIPSEESLLSLYSQLAGETLPLPDWTFFLGMTFFRVIVNIQVGVGFKNQKEEAHVLSITEEPQKILIATRGNQAVLHNYSDLFIILQLNCKDLTRSGWLRTC